MTCGNLPKQLQFDPLRFNLLDDTTICSFLLPKTSDSTKEPLQIERTCGAVIGNHGFEQYQVVVRNAHDTFKKGYFHFQAFMKSLQGSLLKVYYTLFV